MEYPIPQRSPAPQDFPPRLLERSSKVSENATTAPDGLQDAQSCFQVGRDSPLQLLRRPRKASKTAAAAPRQHQEAAKNAQERPKTHPRTVPNRVLLAKN